VREGSARSDQGRLDPDRDVEMGRAHPPHRRTCRRTLLDANMGYRTPGDAIRVFAAWTLRSLAISSSPSRASRGPQVARAIDVAGMADESAWNALT